MSTTADKKAQELADKHPDTWIAVNEGDTITGRIVNVTFAWSDQRNGEYPLLTIEQEDGTEKKVHCFSTVLYNEAMRQRPMPGEKVTIRYLGIGEARVRGQNGAKRYSFRIDGRSTQAIEAMYDRAEGRPTRGVTHGNGTHVEAPPPPPEAEGTVEDDIPF